VVPSTVQRWAAEPAAIWTYARPVHGSVTVHVDAPPDRVWALISDVTNTGRFSPETFDAEWLDGATGPVLGARFRGHVRRNGRKWLVYWSSCTVTRCVPSRDFAFEVDLVGSARAIEWSYLLEPSDGGTDVTESFRLLDWFGSRLYATLGGASRTRTNLRNMRTTLVRLKATAEAPRSEA
jgi:Polyketide cyclase / dehydrase and lipid transport